MSVGVMASAVHIAGGGGELLLSDPCDNFTFAPWTVVSGSPAVTASGHTGNGFSFPANTSRLGYTIPTLKQTDTLTVGCHIKFTALPISPATFMFFRSDTGATSHVEIKLINTGAVEAWRGASSAQLAVAGAGTIAITTWYFIEVSVKLHDTLGNVAIRLNGTPVASATNVDTKDAGTKTVFDQFRITGAGSSAPIADNIYIRNDSSWGP